MALYMEKAFGEEIQRAELLDPRNVVYIAERDGDVVGYTMLRDAAPPDEVADTNALEIARLYSVKRAIGSGVGATLMQRCIDDATARGKQTLWLGVWSRNTRAIAFYQRWEFVDVGTQTFILGNDPQTDHLMARRSAEVK
jgi:GNAT superfamily N-acetyltransferase